ncbi:MAG: methyltransferase [Pseudomonadota bacterium]
MLEFPTTEDTFLDGRVTLVQPAKGAHRSGSDAVFLAACLSNVHGRVLDMGAGVGAVGLFIAAQCSGVTVDLAERDLMMLACCERSLIKNDQYRPRVNICAVDVCTNEQDRIAAGLARAAYDHVVTNPPYRKAGHVRVNEDKRSAHTIDNASLNAWMRTAASCLKPGGSITIIFSADGLTDLFKALDGRFGAVVVKGLHPLKEKPAERVLVRAIKGRKTPLRILPGLIVHDEGGAYSQEARAILQGGRAIDLAYG